jgi:hypothetical protein
VSGPVEDFAEQPQSDNRSPRDRPARSVKRLGVSTAGAVAAALVVATIMYFVGSDNPMLSPVSAAEAVKKAAADTSAAAKSGVIDTELLIDGEAQVWSTFSWNGNDVSLVDRQGPNRELRYVNGLYYETYGYSVPVPVGDTEHAGQWVHVTDYDNGGQPKGAATSAVESPNPLAWLAATRADLAGSGLMQLVAGVTGYHRFDNADGSVTYAGATNAATIKAMDLGLGGLPMAGRPSFEVHDTATRVDIKITVNAEGRVEQLILRWRLNQPAGATEWQFTSTYRELGTAAPIVAPDPSYTVTTDNRF